MTIISNTVATVPVVIVDQVRLTDDVALQELCDVITSEVEGGEIRNVVLDFELVETIGSPGLQMLLRAKSKLQKKGAKLHLCGLGPNVAKVMEETKLRQLFPVHENVETALQAI
jgi:anti-anti-sigma factor